MDRKPLYYLPGRGGRLNAGLGLALQGKGYTLYGRETVGDFSRLAFTGQTEVIANDLQTYFWRHDAHVIANSFGAYLFLHAQSLIPSFPGTLQPPHSGIYSCFQSLIDCAANCQIERSSKQSWLL